MTTTYVHKKCVEGETLCSQTLPLTDCQNYELLVIEHLKKVVPAGCYQLTVRVEVDMLVASSSWRTEVATSSYPALHLPGLAKTQEGKAAAVVTKPLYEIVSLGKGENEGWTLRNFTCPHCGKLYPQRTDIQDRNCLDAYWRVWNKVAAERRGQPPAQEDPAHG